MNQKQQQRCGYVSIIGAPNAGKSTLTNILTGGKVTIVSPKVQTTRSTIYGINVFDNTQLIFCDTPGIFKAQNNLEKAIVHNAESEILNDREIVYIIDAKEKHREANDIILDKIRYIGKKVILVINKIDLVHHQDLLPMIEKFANIKLFKEIFLISAKNKDGIDKLIKYLSDSAPISPFLYPAEQMTTIASRFLAQEITREKIFIYLQEELPYSISVETISYKENDISIKIDQEIYVNKEGQKKILIGENGSLIKKIGTKSRIELEKLLDKKVHLFLHVKIKEDWLDKDYMYSHMGLKFPKK